MVSRWCAICSKFKNKEGICYTIKHVIVCKEYQQQKGNVMIYPDQNGNANISGQQNQQRRHGDVSLSACAQTSQSNPPQQVSPRGRILNEANVIVHKDRNSDYGNPEDNFKQIAALWTAYFQAKLTNGAVKHTLPVFDSMDVTIMSMLIKVARLAKSPAHHDSLVDIAGYAACGGDIQEALKRAQQSVQASSALAGTQPRI